MHLMNELLSPATEIVGGVVAAVLVGVAIRKTRTQATRNTLPMMGALGAFVLAAQMLNISSIAGSSGHLIGGVMLAAMLGPWAGFLTLSAVLAIQALLLGDGGTLALGCNILNMAAVGCLVAYPLLFKPIMAGHSGGGRLFVASVAASVVAAELGALGAVVEVGASGIAPLSLAAFLGNMTSAHLLIGAAEGVATGVILWAVSRANAPLLHINFTAEPKEQPRVLNTVWAFLIGALLIGGGLSHLSSDRPDGLEWSLEKSTIVAEE
jgi:cobalt/nickel transport system permease protein